MKDLAPRRLKCCKLIGSDALCHRTSLTRDSVMKVEYVHPNIFLALGNDFISDRENKDVHFVKTLIMTREIILLVVVQLLGLLEIFPLYA